MIHGKRRAVVIGESLESGFGEGDEIRHTIVRTKRSGTPRLDG